MVLDNEEQRQMLLHLIDSVPVQGAMPQIIEFALKVDALKRAIEAANLHVSAAQEMLLSR